MSESYDADSQVSHHGAESDEFRLDERHRVPRRHFLFRSRSAHRGKVVLSLPLPTIASASATGGSVGTDEELVVVNGEEQMDEAGAEERQRRRQSVQVGDGNVHAAHDQSDQRATLVADHHRVQTQGVIPESAQEVGRVGEARDEIRVQSSGRVAITAQDEVRDDAEGGKNAGLRGGGGGGGGGEGGGATEDLSVLWSLQETTSNVNGLALGN